MQPAVFPITNRQYHRVVEVFEDAKDQIVAHIVNQRPNGAAQSCDHWRGVLKDVFSDVAGGSGLRCADVVSLLDALMAGMHLALSEACRLALETAVERAEACRLALETAAERAEKAKTEEEDGDDD